MEAYNFVYNLLEATLRMGVPLLFASLASVLSERVGVYNLGIEGLVLSGAFFAFGGAYVTGNVWVGIISAAVAGAVLGLAFAYLCITRCAELFVTGAAFNMFALGLTGFCYRALVGVTGAAVKVPQFSAIPIPVLSQIPVIGDLLFNNNFLVYLGLVLVPVVWLYLYRTAPGYELRACGEHPRAADSLGIDVFKVRYAGVMVGAVLAALAGAYLTLAHANTFIENMSAGRGYIAFAIVIFGRWNPVGALLGSLFFGATEALELTLQAYGVAIPYQFLLMLPYVLTMIVLAGAMGKAKPPAAEGVPYSR